MKDILETTEDSFTILAESLPLIAWDRLDTAFPEMEITVGFDMDEQSGLVIENQAYSGDKIIPLTFSERKELKEMLEAHQDSVKQEIAEGHL